MRTRTHILALLVLGASASMASAQNKYDAFVGQYMAATLIASQCQGIGAGSPEVAGDIAKFENGLRKQKVLRLLYYGKTERLRNVGRQALAAREINSENAAQLCRFGRNILGTEDAIGRFLKAR